MKTIALEARFSAAHFYHQPEWSPKKNLETFGRCFTEYGHGHNYKAIAEWREVPEAAYLELREQFNQIISKLDHEHLNFVIPEFKTKVPTTENICEYLVLKIKGKISYPLLKLELYEDIDIGSCYSVTVNELQASSKS